MFLCAGFDCISTSCTVHFQWCSRVGWGIFLESSMPGIPSYPGVDLWGSRSWVALISPLWLSAQSQLTSRLPVGVTTGRMNATDLDKTCKQKKGFFFSWVLSSHGHSDFLGLSSPRLSRAPYYLRDNNSVTNLVLLTRTVSYGSSLYPR